LNFMEHETMHTRLQLARERAGYTSAIQAANAMGIAYPTYAAHENGMRGFSRTAERYARFFKVSIDWLLTGRGAGVEKAAFEPALKSPLDGFDHAPANSQGSAIEPPNARVGEKLQGFGHKIPVYGQAVAGVDGEFSMNGNILFEVMAPPTLSHISGAYGAQVAGDSMSPRYEDGEICFVDPTRRVRKNDYVIAQIHLDEHSAPSAYVKKFVRHNAVELVLQQFNPPKELRFPADAVVSVHFIALAGAA
jgi:phage repressor protein C with HTH and peptisase S24 domain